MKKTTPVLPQGSVEAPRLTQKDISRALGISQSTVAMALNPKYSHLLQESTVARVQAYADEAGYVAPGGGSASPTKTIGIITRVRSYASSQEMLNCLTNGLNRYAVRLLVFDLDWVDGDMERLRDMLRAQPLHGIIVHTVTLDRTVEVLPAGVPVIGVQCEVPGAINLRVDMADVFYHLTRMHLDEDVRDIALLMKFRDGGSMVNLSWLMHERVQGFVTAVLHAGGEVIAEPEAREILEVSGIRETRGSPSSARLTARVLYPRTVDAQWSDFTHGYNVGCDLIGSGSLPQVLVCTNDDIAVGVMAACTDNGVRVPEDLRICGCDNTEAARYGAVPLTSIRRPWDDMAEETVDTLMGLVLARRRPVKSVTYEKRFTAQVMVRASSGAPEELEERINLLRPPAPQYFVLDTRCAAGADATAGQGSAAACAPV